MWRLKRRQTFFSSKRRAVLTPSVAATLRDQYYKPLSPPWVEALKELPIARTHLLLLPLHLPTAPTSINGPYIYQLPPPYTNYPLHLPKAPYIYQRPPTSTKDPYIYQRPPTSTNDPYIYQWPPIPTNNPLHLPTTPYIYQIPPTSTNYPLHIPTTPYIYQVHLPNSSTNYLVHKPTTNYTYVLF